MKILFPEKMIHNLLGSHHFLKFEVKFVMSDKEKSSARIKFVTYIIFLMLFLKAKLSIFACGLIFVDQLH